MNQSKILFTGGSGLLGCEVKILLPNALYPGHKDFDITDFKQMDNFLDANNVEIVVHAAAFTSPPKINENPEEAIDSNIIGTSNIVKLCMKHNIKLIYISTDYVFLGDKGNYKEEDPLMPQNKYAWSKLGGECAVKLYDNSIIVRTSFSENEFPYDKAFIDQWTSRLTARDFAAQLVSLIQSDKDVTGVLHIGGPRRTVFEYANAISPNKKIGELSLKDVSFSAPEDTSLDTSRFNEILRNSNKGENN